MNTNELVIDYDKFLGQAVVSAYRPEQTGRIVGVMPGCNYLFGVLWNGRDYVSWMAPNDVKLLERV